MHALLTLLIVLFALAAGGVMIVGVVGMFRNASPQRSNKLMQYRVLLQAVALGLAALFVYTMKK